MKAATEATAARWRTVSGNTPEPFSSAVQKPIVSAWLKRLIAEQGGSALQVRYFEEIERAVQNVKRSRWDKLFRRAWHQAGARSRWQRRGSTNRSLRGEDRGSERQRSARW
jgi:hypothetical protein